MKGLIFVVKVDIFSGFLGAGKTTLIKKLIKEAYNNEKVVLIENEFGEVGIDGGFLKDAGIEITEMNSGCICCSLVGDFGTALEKVVAEFSPERIIIEPSGVGKLSDVVKAVSKVENLEINGLVAVVDAKKCRMYMKNFGEFFNNQIENAETVILSHTAGLDEDKIPVELIKEHNCDAVIVTTDWEKLSGVQILEAIEKKNSLKEELEELAHHHHGHGGGCGCGHHHHEKACGCHEHHHDDECACGHHHNEPHHEHSHEQCHEHYHEECGCGHHHHEHDEECGCGHHHHEHDEGCGCGHHHHHNADEVFASWGIETVRKFTKEKIADILNKFAEGTEYGMILRAKGIVEGENGEWLHFDYIPGEPDIRSGAAEVTGRLCVIGADLKVAEVEKLFME